MMTTFLILGVAKSAASLFLILLGVALLLFVSTMAAPKAISLVDYANQTTVPMRKAVISKITNESQFLKRLNFIPCDPLLGYRYNREESLGGIAFRGLNEYYTADVGVYNPQIEVPAIMGGTIQTDRQLAGAPNGASVRASRIMARVRKAGLFYDKYVIDGDPGVNAKQFFGLNARLSGNQVISVATNGGALTLSNLDKAIDQTVGEGFAGKIIVCNKAVRRKINALKVSSAGGAMVGDVGKQDAEYNGIPIVVLDEDGDEAAILGFDETQGSSSVATSLYVMRLGSDTDGEYVQGLVGARDISNPIDHVDYGERSGVVEDLVEANLGLAVFHPRAATRIKGILDQ